MSIWGWTYTGYATVGFVLAAYALALRARVRRYSESEARILFDPIDPEGRA